MHLDAFANLLPWHRRADAHPSIGWSALAVAVLASSTSATFAAALLGALSPLSMLFISELLTAVFAMLSFGFFPLLQRIFAIRRRMLLPLLAIGITNSIIAPLLIFVGLKMTGPISTELFIRTEDLFLVLFAILFLKERLKSQHIFGMGAIFFGMTIVILRGFTVGLTFAHGDLLIILGALIYAVGGIVHKKFLHHMESEITVFCRSCTAVAFFFLLSPFLPHTLLQELKIFPIKLIVPLVGYAFASRFLQLLMFYEALERLPVRTVALLFNLSIIGSIFFARMYLETDLEPYHLAGAGFILIGSVLIELESITRHRWHFIGHLKQKQRTHV